MKFTETKLHGAFVIDVDRKEDDRGFFARVWSPDEFAALGLETKIAQCSVSWNAKAGTLRGLHYQAAPHEEVKIVRCTMGAAWDVVVDLRRESATYRQWVSLELTAENRRAMYIPKGFAHGFQTLVDGTELFYQISEVQVDGSAHGVRWDDPALAIAWPPALERVISARDRTLPAL